MPNPTGINQHTDTSKYIPTPAEQKLLEVLCKPDSLGKTISALCEQAGVCREVYYDAIKKPEFFEYRNKLLMDIIKTNVGDVIQACIKYGLNNPKNSKDREMIMRLAGLYEEINVNKNINIEPSPEDVAKIKEKYGLNNEN